MTKLITPQNLTESAREFAPLFVNQSKDNWDLIKHTLKMTENFL